MTVYDKLEQELQRLKAPTDDPLTVLSAEVAIADIMRGVPAWGNRGRRPQLTLAAANKGHISFFGRLIEYTHNGGCLVDSPRSMRVTRLNGGLVVHVSGNDDRVIKALISAPMLAWLNSPCA